MNKPFSVTATAVSFLMCRGGRNGGQGSRARTDGECVGQSQDLASGGHRQRLRAQGGGR